MLQTKKLKKLGSTVVTVYLLWTRAINLYLERAAFSEQKKSVSKEGCFYRYFHILQFKKLKVQSCKLNHNKYMTASTQITNTEIFVLTAVLVFKFLSLKVLFTNKKDNRNC